MAGVNSTMAAADEFKPACIKVGAFIFEFDK